MTNEQMPYSGYAGLEYDREELMAAMRKTYDEIINFVATDAFHEVMTEMGALRPEDRPKFVFDVLLSDDALAERGVTRPEGLMIQRSAFGDRRPTLFVCKKWLPEKYKNVWQNVNITFDNAFVDDSVSREQETNWRHPLPIEEQEVAIAKGRELETI